jgi:hypothetical protein
VRGQPGNWLFYLDARFERMNMLKKLFYKKSFRLFTSSSPALEKFIQSMKIDYMEWHDGIGYDLSALCELREEELKQVETLLISRKDEDWRDVEALAALNTPSAIEALKECLLSKNIDVKLFAVRYLKEMNVVDRVEEIVVSTLPSTKIGCGLTFALALAKKYPTELIKEKLLWCCVNGNDDIRIHCAAMSLFLYGKASSEFDREQKLVFKFGNKEKAKRIEAFSELCQIIGARVGNAFLPTKMNM